MTVKEMPSPEAGLSSPGAPIESLKATKVTGQLIFIVLNYALMILCGHLLYRTVLDVGLRSEVTLQGLLDVKVFFGSCAVFLIFLCIFLITFTGIRVSDASNGRDLVVYQIVVLIAFLFTTVSLFSPLGFHHQLKVGLESGITKGMTSILSFKLKLNALKPDDYTALEETQVKYDCCGWNGPHDYLSLTLDWTKIPLSCCQDGTFEQAQHQFDTCQITDVIRPGCRFSGVYKYADILEGTFILALPLLIILLPLAYLIYSSRQESRS